MDSYITILQNLNHPSPIIRHNKTSKMTNTICENQEWEWLPRIISAYQYKQSFLRDEISQVLTNLGSTLAKSEITYSDFLHLCPRDFISWYCQKILQQWDIFELEQSVKTAIQNLPDDEIDTIAWSLRRVLLCGKKYVGMSGGSEKIYEKWLKLLKSDKEVKPYEEVMPHECRYWLRIEEKFISPITINIKVSGGLDRSKAIIIHKGVNCFHRLEVYHFTLSLAEVQSVTDDFLQALIKIANELNKVKGTFYIIEIPEHIRPHLTTLKDSLLISEELPHAPQIPTTKTKIIESPGTDIEEKDGKFVHAEESITAKPFSKRKDSISSEAQTQQEVYEDDERDRTLVAEEDFIEPTIDLDDLDAPTIDFSSGELAVPETTTEGLTFEDSDASYTLESGGLMDSEVLRKADDYTFLDSDTGLQTEPLDMDLDSADFALEDSESLAIIEPEEDYSLAPTDYDQPVKASRSMVAKSIYESRTTLFIRGFVKVILSPFFLAWWIVTKPFTLIMDGMDYLFETLRGIRQEKQTSYSDKFKDDMYIQEDEYEYIYVPKEESRMVLFFSDILEFIFVKVLFTPISFVCKGVFWIVSLPIIFIGKGLFWVISVPFNVIIAGMTNLVEKIKQKAEESGVYVFELFLSEEAGNPGFIERAIAQSILLMKILQATIGLSFILVANLIDTTIKIFASYINGIFQTWKTMRSLQKRLARIKSGQGQSIAEDLAIARLQISRLLHICAFRLELWEHNNFTDYKQPTFPLKLIIEIRGHLDEMKRDLNFVTTSEAIKTTEKGIMDFFKSFVPNPLELLAVWKDWIVLTFFMHYSRRDILEMYTNILLGYQHMIALVCEKEKSSLSANFNYFDYEKKLVQILNTEITENLNLHQTISHNRFYLQRLMQMLSNPQKFICPNRWQWQDLIDEVKRLNQLGHKSPLFYTEWERNAVHRLKKELDKNVIADFKLRYNWQSKMRKDFLSL